MAAAAVDVDYLAASYAVPQTNIQSLLSQPTVELVQSLLAQLEAKARTYDEITSEKLRSEVELEAAVHDADTRARTLKSAADKAVKEAEELRQKLSREETVRQQIETELQTLQTTASNSTSQVQALESRIKTLEAQNRDAVALHEAKSAAYDRLAEELSAQHQKFVTLRKQVSELEEKNQSLESSATSVKFRESNFQQEIGLLRTSNEWFEAELKTRAADNTKFRKEKNAQIAELQRANADANQTIDSLRNKETSQSKRIEELEQRIEQSLLRTQQLQEEATQNQEQFRAELDNTRRLATLHQESAVTVKKRLQEVQDQLDTLGDQAADEVGRLQAEVDSERIKAAEYENRVAELETMLESQETQISELRNSAYVPGTPRRVMNGAFDTPGRAGSPLAFSPGGSRLKGGLSTTQLYTENTKLKADVRALQEREEKRSATMSEMLEELESRQPEIEELRQENEHLATEISGMSGLLEEALKEKDAARKETRKLQGDYQGLVRQRELDRQLIRDTTFQNKLLLYRQRIQEEGLESLSEEDQKYIKDTENNEIPDHLLDEDDTATSRLLSKHLVLYRDVSQLVDKNQELLRTIREVAQQYEGSEAQAKSAEQEKKSEELSQLRDKLTQYEDEIKSLNLRSQGFMKERDMYRRIITSRGQDTASVLGQSTGNRATATPPPRDDFMSVDQTPRSMNSQAVNQLQSSLDALKEESATDRATFKQQIDELAKENRQLQSDNVRLATRQEMTQQRYDVQQHSISTLESEKSRLQKRYNDLHDELAKFELTKQQHTEDLVEARSQIDSLTRENANLKASQSLWKSIEARLTEDKNALTEDKARLNRIITDMQTLRNEHDLNEAQNRRNLQARVDSLDADLQNAKRKLDEEMEDHKRALLKNDWEQSEKQKKIDNLLQAANEIRQELTSVKSARDQLQSRVDELQTDLHHAEERAQSLQARQTSHINESTESDEDGLNRNDQLTREIAELQRIHERLKEELESVKSNVEVYKSIAEEAETQLQSNLETQEHLQEEMEKKDAQITDLQQRVEEISAELSTTNTELSSLRGAQEQENLQLTQQRDLLESEIERLKDEVSDYKVEVETQKQLVVSQAKIATTAQHNYENELAKHGETMKNLRALRDEHNKLKTEVAQYKAQAEAATTSLAQSEEHWTGARERYEQELAEARIRYSGLEERNKTLYQQLDGVNAQIASLRNNQVSVAAGPTDAVNLESGLQALNKTLRDDKDILQVQINAKDLELQRVRQELVHKQEQLDQANEKLIAEQSDAQSRRSGTNIQALQESIEQLNLYRESNTTLRNLNRQLEAERDEKNKEVESLVNQIQPLQVRVAELEGELEINSGHYKNLEEDRDRWQKRHQDVLHRYDRIDPKELDDLKKQIADLMADRDQALEQVRAMDERIQAVKDEEGTKLEAARTEWADRRQKIVNQAKEKARTDREKIGELTLERDQIKEERDRLKTNLETAQSELEDTTKARDEALANTNTNTDVVMDEEGQVHEEGAGFTAQEKADLEARVAAAEDKEKQQSNQSVSLGIALEGLKERERTLEKQIVSHLRKTMT
jgi:nucleoprotein TPR